MRNMEDTTALEEFLINIMQNIAQYNFDKAKDICKKEKILTTAPQFKEVISVLPCIINVEKCYSELGFLATKSKNTLKAAYVEIKTELERPRPRDPDYNRILQEVMCFSEIRCQLIDFYEKIHALAGYNKHLKIEDYICSLESIVEKYIVPYSPKTLSSIKFLLEMETNCLLDLLRAQHCLEKWNMVLCTSHISSLKAKLNIWESSLHNKETWRLNFFRFNTSPDLYRWILKFKSFIMEKYSLYFYMIIRQQTSLSDLKTICHKNRLEFLQKFQNSLRKCGHEATSIMLIYDACGTRNWHGPGYRCPLKNNRPESSNSYYVMLRHPEKLNESVSLMPTIRRILVENFSDILFLDKTVCRYIVEENATYFITSIEENVNLVAYYNCKKDDRQSDIDNYLLELAWMIRCHRVFNALNPSR